MSVSLHFAHQGLDNNPDFLILDSNHCIPNNKHAKMTTGVTDV